MAHYTLSPYTVCKMTEIKMSQVYAEVQF